MKSIRLAAALFGALLLLNIVNQIYCTRLFDGLLDTLDEAERLYEESGENASFEALGRLRRDWDANYAYLTLINNHDRLEKVDLQLTSLEANLAAGNQTHYASGFKTLRSLIEYLMDNDRLTFRNIF